MPHITESGEVGYTLSEIFGAIMECRENVEKDVYDSDDVTSYRIGAANVLKYLEE